MSCSLKRYKAQEVRRVYWGKKLITRSNSSETDTGELDSVFSKEAFFASHTKDTDLIKSRLGERTGRHNYV